MQDEVQHDTIRASQEPRAAVRPRTDVFETAEHLLLVADVPGADQDSVELSLQEDVLTLRARPVSQVPEGWQPRGSEFELSDYERCFQLTAEIDRDAIQAELSNGQLRVTLKKRPARARRIEVRAD